MAEKPISKNHVATFVDAFREAHGCDPPKQVRARIGAEVAKLVKEGIAVEHLSRGVQLLAEKAQDPSLLPSFVMTAMGEGRNAKDRRERELVARFLEAHGVRWPTGSYFVYTPQAGTYKPDILGCDKPPYDVPWPRPSREDVVSALVALDDAGVDITRHGVRATDVPT